MKLRECERVRSWILAKLDAPSLRVGCDVSPLPGNTVKDFAFRPVRPILPAQAEGLGYSRNGFSALKGPFSTQATT